MSAVEGGLDDGGPAHADPARWQALVAEIVELEELIDDVRDQPDTASVFSLHRLQEQLGRKRRELRDCDVGGIV